jgi:hypothetical protein
MIDDLDCGAIGGMNDWQGKYANSLRGFESVSELHRLNDRHRSANFGFKFYG